MGQSGLWSCLPGNSLTLVPSTDEGVRAWRKLSKNRMAFQQRFCPFLRSANSRNIKLEEGQFPRSCDSPFGFWQHQASKQGWPWWLGLLQSRTWEEHCVESGPGSPQGPRNWPCPDLQEHPSSGGASGLSTASFQGYQLPTHLLLPLALPSGARWRTLQPVLGEADYSEGCRGKDFPGRGDRKVTS